MPDASLRSHSLRVCRRDELGPGSRRRVELDGKEILLLNVEGTLFALENRCPHQQFALLHEGSIEAMVLTCPMHGWSFDLRTGRSTSGGGRLKLYPLRIDGDDVWMETEGMGTA